MPFEWIDVPTCRSVDLGCGGVKPEGFVGLDRYAQAGVDVVADLNRSLPFRNDSVDLVYASHSLEHVADLLAVVKEMYRVCTHGAQVCIVAPYYHQALNVANPYHTQVFNEHTPRFWTNAPTTRIPLEEFAHPHAVGWGTSESDGSSPGIDFRCLRMEFFYFPEYRHLPLEDQRAARKKYSDVCDQIMFHLVAIKTPVSESEVERMAEQIEYYDPPRVTIRRLQEDLQGRENTIQELRRVLTTREAEIGQLKTRCEMADDQATELEQTQSALAEVHGQLGKLVGIREMADARAVELGQAQTELAHTRGLLGDLRAETGALRQRLATQEAEIDQVQGSQAAAQAELAQARAPLAATERKLARWQHQARALSTEMAGTRHRRALRIAERFWPGPDLAPQIDPTFQNLLDDSYLFLGNLRGYRLQPSENLQTLRVLAYALTLGRPNLSGLMLAPIIDLPDDTGSLGIELATPDGSTVAHARVSLSEIEPHRPVRLVFPPVPSSAGGMVLRVDVRDTATPARLFEWRKRRFLGLGRLATRPFCAFIFE
jgi:SAM-dependent methyltransferase